MDHSSSGVEPQWVPRLLWGVDPDAADLVPSREDHQFVALAAELARCDEAGGSGADTATWRDMGEW